MPLAALGLASAAQPVAVAILTVGSHDCCGSGRVGEGPKLCSAVTASCGSLQAASGSASAAIAIANPRFLRMVGSLNMASHQCGRTANVHHGRHEFRVT